MFALFAAHAYASTLSFDEVVRESLAQGAAAAVAATERDLARAQATGGASLANPTASIEQIGPETELRVAVPVPLIGQPIAAWREASALRSAADVRGELGRAQAGLDAGEAYLDAQRAVERAQLAEETLALATRRRDAARQMLDAEEIGRVDAAAADAEAGLALSVASVAQQEALGASVALEVLLGREPTGELVPAGWPVLPLPDGSDASPLAAEASHRARAAQSTRSRARLDLVPSPSLTAGWQRDLDGESAILGVEVALPLFSPGAARVRTADAEARRAAAVAEYVALDARGRWLVAVSEVKAAETAWAATEPSLLRDALSELADAFASGALSLSDYVARRDAIVGGLEASIDARHRLELARLELWRRVGRLPPEVSP